MKIVTTEEMRRIDLLTTEKFGVPSLDLMENAGSAVAQFILREYPDAERISVLCGKGNNGGDGFVAARHLLDAGRKVKVVLVGEVKELKGDAAHMHRRWKRTVKAANSAKAMESVLRSLFLDSEIIVDALLGTGFKPPVKEPYGTAIRFINQSPAIVVAVDVPSGADSDSLLSNSNASEFDAVQPDAIVTFTAPKAAHVFQSEFAVPATVAPIGSPEEAITSEGNLNLVTIHDLPSRLLIRPEDSHKGRFGHALIVGGSRGKGGAAAMAGMACLRVGAGLTTVATPKSTLPLVAGFAPELMTEALTEAGNDSGSVSAKAGDPVVLTSLLERKTVVAIGPGLSNNPDTAEFVHRAVKACRVPLVLDADALNVFEGMAEKLNGCERPMVLTPHPGEMSRLTGLSVEQIEGNRIEVAREFAREHKLFLVLKGWRTLIAEPGGAVWVNTTGNPGMAKGGSGDVLTGMLAGLMAQIPDDIAAAVRAAVYLHGLAGDFAQQAIGTHSMAATDIIRHISSAFGAWRQMVLSGVVWINPGKRDLARGFLLS